jgi:L-alanine-DL-glutamate epimerase-like enolase superfamily enzyme
LKECLPRKRKQHPVKIQDIRTHVVAEKRNFLFVVVETDEGIIGVGEAGITWARMRWPALSRPSSHP